MSHEFEYDVFLSHSSEEKQGVIALAEKLKAAGLRVWLDTWEIKPGQDIRRAIDEGVRLSHTMVMCISPAAIDSEWVEMEHQSVLFRDPNNKDLRFIPLLFADCKLPRGLERFKYIDYRDESLEALQELVACCHPDYGKDTAKASKLRQPEVDMKLAGQGLASLKSLLRDPAVKARMLSFQSDFLATRENIRVLQAYKEMHDVLHTLQFQCHEILHELSKLVAASPATWALVAPVESTLQQQMKRGTNYRSLLPEGDTEWFGDLEQASDRLREASAETNPDGLKEADDQINRVISIHLATINTRLTSQARNLRLDLLLKGLSSVADVLGGSESEETSKFLDGIEALKRLETTLRTLVDHHDEWQNVDRELRPAEASLAIGTQMIATFYWPNIKSRLDQLCKDHDAEDWVVAIRAAVEKLEAALPNDHPNEIEPAFRGCYRAAGQQFYNVDLKLKELCSQLASVGEELSLVLNELS